MRKTYWQNALELWKEKEWISNEDFRKKTHGSPKWTSRVSDMRNKGVKIIDRYVYTITEGRHKEYKLATPPEEVKRIMSKKVRGAA